MKLALISAKSLVLALAHHLLGARAQFGNYGIPSCATACMEQAAIQGRCGFTDIACICRSLDDTAVMDTAVTCELASCPATQTGDETATTAFGQFFEGFC